MITEDQIEKAAIKIAKMYASERGLIADEIPVESASRGILLAWLSMMLNSMSCCDYVRDRITCDLIEGE